MKVLNKKSLLLSVAGLLFSFIVAFAQAPNWQWAKHGGGSGGFDWSKIAVDANGNAYVAGAYDSPSITFSSFTLANAGGGNNYPSDMPWDLFLVKYDSSGNVIWAKSFGGNSMDMCGDITVDANGNIYLTGSFRSNALMLGSITLTNTTNTFIDNFFVVKFDSSGNAIWAYSNGASGGSAIVTDAYANLYVTGNYGSAVFGNTALTSSGASDIFIAKFDSNTGNVIWAKSAGGSVDNDYSSAIAVDLSGNIFVTGLTLSPTIAFDNITLTNNVADIFVVKYSASGNVLWAQNADGDGYAYSKGISTDANGNLYLTGYVVGNSITFGNITLTSRFFIVKYDASGNVVWAKPGGGAATYGMSISTDANGNSFVAGSFQYNINFGSYQLNNSGILNIFLVKYDDSGNVIWAKKAGGASYDTGSDISIGSNESLYLTGVMSSPIVSFDSINLTTGNAGVYVAKLIDNCPSLSSPTSIFVSGGNPKVCAGDTRTYTTAAIAGVTYHWTVPTGGAITSGQGTNSITVSYNNNLNLRGEIAVVKTNNCGSSIPRYLRISKNVPLTPSAISGLKFGLCGGRNIVYSVLQVQGMIYNWTVPGLAHIVSGQGTNSITVNFQSVNFQKTISVTANNSCGTGAARNLVIRSAPEKPGVINGPSAVCTNGGLVTYNILPVYSAIDYTWTAPAGAHITANGITSTNNILTTSANMVGVDFGTISSNSYLRVKANNTCGISATSSLPISIGSADFTLEFFGDPSYNCSPNCDGWLEVTPSDFSIDDYTYLWNDGETSNFSSGACAGAYTVTVWNAGGCSKTETGYIADIADYPNVTCFTFQDESYPGAYDGIIEANASGNGYFNYEWTGPVTDPNWDYIASGLTAGTYTVTAISQLNYCRNSSTCTVITLSPRLEQSPVIKQITARPNPFTNVLQLDIITDENLTLTLKDISGRIVNVYPNINTSIVINEHLNEGMYFINAENQSGTFQQVLKVVCNH